MKDKPWIFEDDPLKDSYGLLNKSELECFKDAFKYSCERNIDNNTILLLDFYNRFNEDREYALFEQLCSIAGDHLYWVPSYNNELSFWGNYLPPMIAKTPAKKDVINNVRASFMQMINGAYLVFDSESRFWGEIIDGYYMVVFIKKEFAPCIDYKFVENWDCIKENLDAILIDDLYKRNNIKPVKTGVIFEK